MDVWKRRFRPPPTYSPPSNRTKTTAMILPPKTRFRLALFGAAICLSTAGPASAVVLASDNFNYPEGTFVTDAWNGGTGWNGAWRDSSGTATYDPAIGADGRLHTESASTGDRHKGAIRTLSNSYDVASNGPLWGSVSMSVTNVGETGQYAWLSFVNGTTEQYRFGRYENSNTNWGLQIGNAAVNFVGGTTPGSTVVIGEAVRLLFQMEFVDGNTIYNLWVNPAGSTEGDLGTPDATITSAGSPVFDGIRLQSRASATFDDVILGTTFADVIPEPSSMMLGVLGSGLLLIRKRRD